MDTIKKTKEETFSFKTNINCSGCVAQLKPILNEVEGICHWDVDTVSKDKILTVQTKGISENEIIEVVQNAGFNIQTIKS